LGVALHAPFTDFNGGNCEYLKELSIRKVREWRFGPDPKMGLPVRISGHERTRQYSNASTEISTARYLAPHLMKSLAIFKAQCGEKHTSR
jgi:hypothetical protein